jgi:hypothetical protein
MSTTTTSYGTWVNHGDGEIDLDTNVTVALGDHVDDFDVEGLIDAYRAAINDNLPDGIVLAGSDFYGPYPRPDEAEAIISAAIDAVDFWALADRFDQS